MSDLAYKRTNVYEKADESTMKAIFDYAEGYRKFIDGAKTEREACAFVEKAAKKQGYKPFAFGKKLKPGDKVYYNNRGKNIYLIRVGSGNIGEEGIRIVAAHIDSPRVDLKQVPLYESDGVALAKTHYYGGIRKYQWATIPLAMHGVVILKDGTSMDICIGEKEGDPVFCVTDLLPHLAAQQNERKLKDGIKGEELNIIVGSLPYPCEEEDSIKEPVKLLALSILNERFGMTEKDFLRAEIEFVPAVKATDVGLDRSLVGAYGQDDKVCAYTALTAEMKAKSPEYTTVTILADKEEIGSVGNTGLNSDFTLHYIEGLCKAGNVDVRKVLKHSLCLSADVNAAYDPTFASVFEEKNSCYLNKGVVLTKYTGARGKSGSNDASAETMAKVIQIMDEAGVYWQIGELGAVDVGGGGTVALFVAGMDVDVVDMGVPILSMHAPFELASKLDIYNTYLAFAAFCR